MRRPVAALLAPLATSLALVLAPAPSAMPSAAPAPADGDGPVVTGFVLGGTRAAVVRRSTALDQVTVVGAALTADGEHVRRPGADAVALLERSQRRGLHGELLLSNYSNRLGDFDARAAHRLLDSPAHVRAVAARLARLVRSGGWDGVNVDLELVRRADAHGLVSLVVALQRRMPDARTVSIDVSAATSVAGYRERGYAMRGLGRAADVVVLMAYDLHGPTWSGPGAVGPLRWQRRAVAAAREAIAADRLDLGVAGYGYTWPRSGTGRSITVAQARRLVARDDARARWHPAVGEWSARLSDGTRMWWSDRRSYALRRAMARDLGLHGVAVWRLGSADPITRHR